MVEDIFPLISAILIIMFVSEEKIRMSHLLLLGKFEYGGGPFFKVVLEC